MRCSLAPQPAVTLPAGHPPAIGDGAVTITAGISYALATVTARRQRTDLLVERVRDAFGLAPPLTPRRVAADATAFAWAGPGHWLAMAEGTDGPAFEGRLRAILGSPRACPSTCIRALSRRAIPR
jgi:sarcosine oxidase subunit gamma